MAVMPEPKAPLAVNAYAKHRGVRIAAVQNAIAHGWLERSLGQDARGKPQIIDVALADQEWAERGGRHPKSAGLTTIAQERQRLLQAQRRKIDLHIRERRGDLIPRRKMEIRFATRVVTARTKLLGIPSRAKQRIPHLTTADLGVLEDLIREALDELGEAQE